jgi:hypothetical protein
VWEVSSGMRGEKMKPPEDEDKLKMDVIPSQSLGERDMKVIERTISESKARWFIVNQGSGWRWR